MPNAGRKQRGIATVLIMLLVGISLSAAVLSSAYYIQSTQDQGMSVHAQAQAQMKTWSAVEIVRLYFTQLQTAKKMGAFLATVPTHATTSALNPAVLSFTGDGATDSMSAKITDWDAGTSQITAEVTGVTAKGSKAEASSTLQVVYSITGDGTSTGSVAAGSSPKATAVFNGDVTLSGAATNIMSSPGTFADVAIAGNLSITSAAQAMISGCAKGNININGGGIDPNATLKSEGTISIDQVTAPTNASLWGKNIVIGNTASTFYNELKAGAYSVNVMAAGAQIGTATIGGKIIPGTGASGATIPWTTGTVVPWSAGLVAISLTDGTVYLLDMSKTTIASNTGLVTNTGSAALLSGSTALPNSLTFVASGIYGGGLDIYTLTVGTVWGHAIKAKGYRGLYTTVLANGEFQVIDATISGLKGGADLVVTAVGSFLYPTVTGVIEGKIYGQTATTKIPIVNNALINVVPDTPGASPGLPGIPYCDVRVNAINADDYKAQANYVFEVINGRPQLTIQNVTFTDPLTNVVKSIDGIYDFSPSIAGANKQLIVSLMTCGYTTDPGCLKAWTGTTWGFTGVSNFPKGVVWFDGRVTVNGTTVDLVDTFISKGDIAFTTAGHKRFFAPNFSTPALVCGGNFVPTNICNTANTPPTFVTWQDNNAVVHTGTPLANMAIITEGGVDDAGWTITGNVILGQSFLASAQMIAVNGFIVVGANQFSTTVSKSGGFTIDSSNISTDQAFMPTKPTAVPNKNSVTLKWSRHL